MYLDWFEEVSLDGKEDYISKSKMKEMCEYCEGEELRKAIYCAAGNIIGIPKENMLIMQRDSMTYIWTRINYCPMCGRKLEEDIKE